MSEQNELWGEFTEEDPKVRYDYSSVIEHAKKPNCLDEYLEILPGLNTSQKNKQLLIQLQPMDPRICYTIMLHQYANQISDLIKRKNNGTRSKEPLIPAPLPKPPVFTTKCKEDKNEFGYLPKKSNEFTLGVGIDTPRISESVKNNIIKKCTATMLAHVGFETTTTSTLDALSDVLDDFLRKMCTNLRNAVDINKLGMSSGFPDEVERVFAQMGLEGVQTVHDFYVNRVIKYQDVVYNECKVLLKEFEESEKEEIPEFHLSGNEDDDHNDLQPELHLLDLLERNDEFSLDAFGNAPTFQDLEQIINL